MDAGLKFVDEELKDQDTDGSLGAICKIISDLNSLEKCIDCYEPENSNKEQELFTHINDFVGHLKELDQVRKATPAFNIDFPREMLDMLDDSEKSNPELFSQDMVNRCADENIKIRLKTKALERLKKELNPQEYVNYS
mmetsp:Transcript_1520/g.2186  ORF Transcript_1520/g.2186 Transcript_1520/m.2186 type:complete len:138 (+) Transcript_1520:38-451(+)